ncbi:MAG: hypothetical protein ABFS43_06310 [Thermodesulfobacteriota bacterium]
MIYGVLSISFRFFIIALILFYLTGCLKYGHVVLEDDNGKVSVEVENGNGHNPGHYESNLPKIPPGQMPPPGKCRIWFPSKPPGQQPPPGDCIELKSNIPPGAWLIRGN